MSKISIKDLADSIELDQAAMSAILGGARTSRNRQQQLLRRRQAQSRSPMRLFDLARNKQMARR
jgi:hypothetical protein